MQIIRKALDQYGGWDVDMSEEAFEAAVGVAWELVGSMKSCDTISGTPYSDGPG